MSKNNLKFQKTLVIFAQIEKISLRFIFIFAKIWKQHFYMN